jgi:hypothetical protein
MKLLVQAALNSLSFGNVSVNILKEFFNKNIEIGLFPFGNVDLSVFNLSNEFKEFLQKSINQRFDALKKDVPAFKLWHLNSSDDRKNPNQNLLTFYECSEPTKTEVAIAQAQDKIFFSSTYAQNKFIDLGCENTSFVPMGFDPDLHITNKKYLDVVHFGLMGKFEHRKHTEKIIKTWLNKYGNNNEYQLSCCVTNPFFKPEQMQAIINNLLQGKRYTNINFIPYLQTNQEVNEFLNAIDIDLTGLSGAEGWNLPAFNATCLGKWSIVLNETSHKDWATSENSILVESDGKIPAHDGVFFLKGHEFNQGEFYSWSEEAVVAAMESAVKKYKVSNVSGIEMSKKFSYKNTAEIILDKVFS